LLLSEIVVHLLLDYVLFVFICFPFNFLFKRWLTAYLQNQHDGRVFAAENFLSWRTLVTLAGIKRQFLELLASIGFVPVKIGPRRGGYDNILTITGPEVSNNLLCFNTILTAWTIVQFPCIVFMNFTEQIQYILSVYTHIFSLILLKRL
jgi:hypothetical protein